MIKKESPEKLAQSKPEGPEIIGAVYIHPSAHVDPTSKVHQKIHRYKKYHETNELK